MTPRFCGPSVDIRITKPHEPPDLEAVRSELCPPHVAALNNSHQRSEAKIISSAIEAFVPFMWVIDIEHHYVTVRMIVSDAGALAVSEEAAATAGQPFVIAN